MNISSSLFHQFFSPIPNHPVHISVLSAKDFVSPSSKFINQQNINELSDLINVMGQASALSQGLRTCITSYIRLLDSDHRLYLITNNNEDPSSSSSPLRSSNQVLVVGFLKVGYKKLYFNNATGQLHECKPLCILDFYICEQVQRQGHGLRLFNYMLYQENVNADDVAYDRPSPKLIAFLHKHFSLTQASFQPNKYVIFNRQTTDIQPFLTRWSPLTHYHPNESTATLVNMTMNLTDIVNNSLTKKHQSSSTCLDRNQFSSYCNKNNNEIHYETPTPSSWAYLDVPYANKQHGNCISNLSRKRPPVINDMYPLTHNNHQVHKSSSIMLDKGTSKMHDKICQAYITSHNNRQLLIISSQLTERNLRPTVAILPHLSMTAIVGRR